MTISARMPNHGAGSLDRRDFLWRAGGGFGAVVLAHLMGSESLLADVSTGKCSGLALSSTAACTSRQGEAGGAAFHVGRGQPVRHV